MRNKLARSVARLDERRHDAFDVRKVMERHLKQVAIAGGVVVVGTAATAAFVMHRDDRGAASSRRALAARERRMGASGA